MSPASSLVKIRLLVGGVVAGGRQNIVCGTYLRCQGARRVIHESQVSTEKPSPQLVILLYC